MCKPAFKYEGVTIYDVLNQGVVSTYWYSFDSRDVGDFSDGAQFDLRDVYCDLRSAGLCDGIPFADREAVLRRAIDVMREGGLRDTEFGELFEEYVEVDMDKEPEQAYCINCGGPAFILGPMGAWTWYRCRNCGLDFHAIDVDAAESMEEE